MEKLIIEYYHNYDTEEEKEAFNQKTLSIFKDSKKSFKDLTDYMENYCDDNYAKTTKEYPEKLFKNMKTMEEVFEFLLIEQGCIGKAVGIPKSFKNLKPWIPSYVTEEYKQKFLEEANKNCFYYQNDWTAEHRNISKEVLNKADKIKF